MFISLLLLVALISSAYTFRMYIEGFQIGDPFDTRLLISQHEHWFRFFSGETKLRDTNFFFPFDKALGFTESSFLTSLPYSALRAFDFHPVSAWSIAIFIFFLLGNIGWAFLSRTLFQNKFVQVCFVWTISTFPTLIILSERATQILFFSWISWLTFLTVKSIENFKLKRSNYTLAIFIVLMPLIMLTSWYPAFFFLLTLFSIFITLVLIEPKIITEVLSTIRGNLKLKVFKPVLVALPFSLLLALLWGYIHLPLLTVTNRVWSETINYSSYISEVLNQQYLNNGWYFYLFKNSQYEPFQQSNIAIPILTLSLSAIFFIFSYFLKDRYISNYRNLILLPTIFIFFIFLRLTEEFSLYKIFWENIPGLQSIRFPYRYIIILGFILIGFIFITFDNLIKKQKSKKSIQITTVFVALALGVDSLKPTYAIWSESDYLSKNLEIQITEIQKNCDFFILDKPGGWWDDQISGMALSALSGIPTANGYSGGFPTGYPTKPWNFDGDISEILIWSGFGTNDQKGCLVSDSHPLIVSNPRNTQIYFHSGFSPQESNEKGVMWRWAESSTTYLLLNTPINKNSFTFEFELKTPDCVSENKMEIIKLPNKSMAQLNINQKASRYEIEFVNNDSGITKLMFKTEDLFCNFQDDPRNLFFELKNYKIS